MNDWSSVAGNGTDDESMNHSDLFGANLNHAIGSEIILIGKRMYAKKYR